MSTRRQLFFALVKAVTRGRSEASVFYLAGAAARDTQGAIRRQRLAETSGPVPHQIFTFRLVLFVRRGSALGAARRSA